MPRKKDENQSAFSVLEELIRRDAERDGAIFPSIPPEEKDPKAVAAGKLHLGSLPNDEQSKEKKQRADPTV